MALSNLTTEAVFEAIQEFDQLGRDAFLKKYAFGKARSFELQFGGRSYDSKAIAGAAHGNLPGERPLTFDEFQEVRRLSRKFWKDLASPSSGRMLRLRHRQGTF